MKSAPSQLRRGFLLLLRVDEGDVLGQQSVQCVARTEDIENVIHICSPKLFRPVMRIQELSAGRWQNQQTPGEVRSFWLLLLALLKPRFLCNPHKRSVQSVSQV